MNVKEWNERYRAREREAADFHAAPTPLVMEFAQHLRPGKALDLACGTGRDTLWLAARRWSTAAVDGSEIAIAALRSKAYALGLQVETRVADLTKQEFSLGEANWDLILMCYYFQRDLFPAVKKAVVPGGSVMAVVHIPRAGEQSTDTRAQPGELASFFEGWSIVRYYEGESRDPAHHRPVAEIVAHCPGE